jgi:hypothetical protein
VILVTGRGKSGSWQIRGNQLGNAIGAHVEPNASKVSQYRGAVIVKRPRTDLVYRLHQSGIRIVWDVVDSWPQPLGNSWDRTQCLGWLREQVKTVKPYAIVAATEAMAVDCDFHTHVLTLPHHARPNQRANPVRNKVKTVGYEGGEQYLGSWKPWLEVECKRRGWRFIVNPPEIANLDILVAVRDATGYAARKWKSNVKLANAKGSGTPCVLNREAGYLETQSGAERWADTREEMVAALDELTDVETRRSVSAQLLQATPTLERIADKYKTWLQSTLKY